MYMDSLTYCHCKYSGIRDDRYLGPILIMHLQFEFLVKLKLVAVQ